MAGRYRLLLLSNTNAIHFEMLRREYPLLRHFHGMVLSHEVHLVKPQPAIFEAAVRLAGCSPEECFYTDDVPEFVDAARTLGIDSEQFRGVEKLERELASRGIVWK